MDKETVYLRSIEATPEDYFVCTICNTINLYDNESCHECEGVPRQNHKGKTKVKKWVEAQYEYYEEEGLDPLQIAVVTVEVNNYPLKP